jgi:hypothetical protein
LTSVSRGSQRRPYQLTADVRLALPRRAVAYSATFRADGHDADDRETDPNKRQYEYGNGA